MMAAHAVRRRAGIVLEGYSMNLTVADETRARLAKYGPNKLFGDYDKRQEMPVEQLVRVFNNAWNDSLAAAVQGSAPCRPEEARRRLSDKEARFFDESQEHREFRLHDRNMEFIVQLRRGPEGSHEVTQLWHIKSTDSHPKTLFVTFESVEEREAFRELARRLGWHDEALGLALLRDFMGKFSAGRPPGR